MESPDECKELSASEEEQILKGLKDAEEGKVMDSMTFWNNLQNG